MEKIVGKVIFQYMQIDFIHLCSAATYSVCLYCQRSLNRGVS
jgi:hypothetical protein